VKGPQRAKRLYRVFLWGVSGTVRHFQDKRAAIEWAEARVRRGNGGLHAEIHESFLVEWRDEPFWASDPESPEKPTLVPEPSCVANWPGCFSGGYDPRCCRFPKSCSVRMVEPESPDIQTGEKP
jgi:hypothetical protein